MMGIKRHRTKAVRIGGLYIGGNSRIAIQSMAKTKTADIKNTVKQINQLASVGCEIVRVAVRDSSDAKAIRKIRPMIGIPLVADIHFNWRLALEAIDSGADKIRLNPGNIYKRNQVREIAAALKQNRRPLRIGVNSGSLKQANSKKISAADRLVRSALDYLKMVEGFKFYDIVISLKASNISDTITAYRKIAQVTDYPLHLGLTATGFPREGIVKSSIAIGALLLEGIGDTIRVSLTDLPQEEIKAAKLILASLGLRNFGPQIISCPTCGRCEVDLVKIIKKLESRCSMLDACRQGRDARCSMRPRKVAVMGCVVNGPGEAREADIGIAFGKTSGLLFKQGKPLHKVSTNKCVATLMREIHALV